MAATCLMLDVDGVLIDGRPGDGLNWKTGLAEDLGLEPRDLSEGFFRRVWSDVVTGRRALLPELEAALARMGSSVRAEDLVAYWFDKDSRVVAPVLADLRHLRSAGRPVFLATNQDHLRARYLMQEIGLEREVDGIVYSAQAGHQKPEAEFFAFAEQATGYRPENLLLVDDTEANVLGARRAGWAAVHWTGAECLREIVERHCRQPGRSAR